ncbi:hypothetical protein SAMN05660226_01601 [Parapedobacter luteus]|uniref:Peptidase M1 membrane alanine aminopeptidase domain-containing protein n=2 Tax=Sphingobacteriaceae TaxID=84566 RepID=A0A1T5BMS8_9SPHI|nr:hypothetical protein SAMN05660226_01601 [Parapedobacter luteus]
MGSAPGGKHISILIRPLPKAVVRIQKAEGNYITLVNDLDEFYTLAHEVSHTWWNRGNHHSMEKWLTESFAEYASLMYLRFSEGDEPFNTKIQKLREKSVDLPSLLLSDRFGRFGNDLLYVKDGLFLFFKIPDVMSLFVLYLGGTIG